MTDNLDKTPKALALPPNAPRPLRLAMALQDSPLNAVDVPLDLDAALLPLLERDDGRFSPSSRISSVSRANLPEAVLEVIPQQGEGTTLQWRYLPTVEHDERLSEVEKLLFPTIGNACARAGRFLYEWLTRKYFTEAAKLSGINMGVINMLRDCSPVFKAIYDRVDAVVKSGRLAHAEDTLHALATGEATRWKEALTRDGGIVTLKEQVQSDKALAITLAAGNPALYGSAAGKSGATVNVQVVMEVPRPERMTPAVDVTPVDSGKQAVDVDFIEA